mmetsp:Transcript_6417/g.19414  ORF Transcript_6417/g.19414 Transcript_6417/m.19414 type:complete len:157 (-) Transcript_6417:104-574(-)
MRLFHTACPYTSLPICYCRLFQLVNDRSEQQMMAEALLARAAFSKKMSGYLPKDMVDPYGQEAVLAQLGLIMDSADIADYPPPFPHLVIADESKAKNSHVDSAADLDDRGSLSTSATQSTQKTATDSKTAVATASTSSTAPRVSSYPSRTGTYRPS